LFGLLLRGDYGDSGANEGVCHAAVIRGHASELVVEAERAGDVDGIQCSYMDRGYVARGSDDVLAQLDDRGGGENALKDQATVDDCVGPVLS
jgi:hypothetical protein